MAAAASAAGGADDDAAAAGYSAKKMASELAAKKSEAIRVVVRVRPLSKDEIRDGRVVCAVADTRRMEVALRDPNGKASDAPKLFTFDQVYGPNVLQRDIYDSTAASIVDSVIDGYNGTIFAYGQTGAGKTFTMEGKPDEAELRGIMPNAFKHIFDRIDRTEQSERQFLVRASYLEIYNETIRDLLSKDPSAAGLELKQNADGVVYVKGLASEVVKSATDVDALLRAGKKNRKTGATLMNAESSRSHAVFTVTVENQGKGLDGKEHICVGKLNMVDLAGSERQGKTGATGDRLKEATKINLSLSALGGVISALINPKSTHIPYRDSLLTRLLQDSLGGNTKTVMVANCGPADYNYDETMSTLRYADRAKRIKNKPKINEDPKDAMLRQFQEEIERLRRELEAKSGEGGSTTVMVDGKPVVVLSAAGPATAVERVGLSDEERKELEAQAAKERLELERRAEEERSALLIDKAKTEEEKERLRGELEERLRAHEQAESERLQLLSQLEKMQAKMVMGGRLLDKATKQEAELKRAKRELEQRRQQEERLAREMEEANVLMEEQYSSLQEEATALRRKLKKINAKYQAAKAEAADLEEEFQREREGLLNMMRELTRTTKLKQALLDAFVPPQELERLEASSSWDEEAGAWTVHGSELAGNYMRPGRPIASEGARMPEAAYSRARRQYDPSPRFSTENIAQLALDPTAKTTTTLRPAAAARERTALLDDDGASATRYLHGVRE